MDFREFLSMGGYAGYVWSGYGLTALILVWNWWSARRSEAEQLVSAQRRSAD